jgi:hypothetical protein
MYDSIKPVVLVGPLEGNFAASFALGWAVTTGAGLASYPLDTIRRRMMMTSGSKVRSSSRGYLQFSLASHLLTSFSSSLTLLLLRPTILAWPTPDRRSSRPRVSSLFVDLVFYLVSSCFLPRPEWSLIADRPLLSLPSQLFKGAGANILRGVAGAGVLSLYDKMQELMFGKVYSGGSG